MNSLPKLAVLISGNGTNLEAVIDAIRNKLLQAEISVVISSNSQAYGLERARKVNIPALAHDWKNFKSSGKNRLQYEDELLKLLEPYKPDLVVLAGFMFVLSPIFLSRYTNRIINVHPAYLPEDVKATEVISPDGSSSPVFRGNHVVAKAIAAGVTFAGCTVHLVTEDLDAGPVLARVPVPILPGDTPETLHARIQIEEHKILPLAIEKYLKQLFLRKDLC